MRPQDRRVAWRSGCLELKTVPIALTFACALLLFLGAVLSADAAAAIEIPYLQNIMADGDDADWGDEGFRVEMMTYRQLEGLEAEDFEPRYRLGWNDEGLLVLLDVRDNAPVEQSIIQNVWEKDAARIAVTPQAGDSAGFVAHVAPGADPESPEPKIYFEDGAESSRGGRTPSAVVARKVKPGAYAMEILFPWKNFDRVVRDGDEFDFQLTVSDIDNRAETIWTSGWNADSSYRLRLARKASPPVVAYAKGGYERLERTRVTVCAVKRLAGKRVTLVEGRRRVAKGKLEGVAGRAVAELSLPMPALGETWTDLKAVIRGWPPLPIQLPDANEIRARKFTEARVRFDSFVFEGSRFPGADFVDSTFSEPLLNAESIKTPSFVKSLIGPYSLKTTYYDKDFNVVTEAGEPGRYGAVVEIAPREGRVTRRFLTLFRCPAGLGMFKLWTDTDMNTSVRFPDALGISIAPGTRRARAVDEFFLGEMTLKFIEGSGGAALLAGLYESESLPGQDKAAYDPFVEDRQWWVEFKRKFYRLEDRYPGGFMCPRPIEGESAPVLHEGAPAEAGMKEDAPGKIDAVLEEWAADSDEAFSVCIARRGVIVLHKAYGRRHGRPMTVETPSWMASITKMLSASLMMMLVDQGLVDMDAPVTEYLPPFRDIKVEKPITVRNLYTHTGGLWGHWGDDMHDMEEVLADYSPHLACDRLSFYNGAGNALGSKILELVSGETLPRFYRKHLLDPLECDRTEVSGSMGDAKSVPLDMARIGQMLLNGGAYGRHRFMRKETFERMLPARMTKQFGPNTTLVKGFGCQWFSEHGLSARTAGHGAASSATFRIDLDNELVIVMCRNSAGTNYNVYHPRFIAAIVDGLAD